MHSKNVAEPFHGILNEFAPHVPSAKLAMVDCALLLAAAEFLGSGSALHKVRVGGKMMDRADVAVALKLKADPPPHGAYRDAIEDNDTRS